MRQLILRRYQFYMKIWEREYCFRSRFRVHSHQTRGSNASTIQSVVSKCSNEIKRYVAMYKTWIHNYKFKSEKSSAKWTAVGVNSSKQPKTQKLAVKIIAFVLGACLEFFSLTVMKKAKLLTVNITWHYWIDWVQKSGQYSMSKGDESIDYMNWALIWFLTHRTLQIWLPATSRFLQTWRCSRERNLAQMWSDFRNWALFLE